MQEIFWDLRKWELEEKSMPQVPEKGKKRRKNHLSGIFQGHFFRAFREKDAYTANT